MGTIAVAEAASSAEGNTSPSQGRDGPGTAGVEDLIIRAHRHYRYLGSPAECSGLATRGRRCRGRPEDRLYARQGGGSGCSTVDAGEGNEPDGGKVPTIGEPGQRPAGPDADLETPAPASCSG